VVGATVHPLGWVVPGGYVAAIAAGSLKEGRGLPAKARMELPVALATMHFSWGWGFLTSPRGLAATVIESRGSSGLADAQMVLAADGSAS
jgi:hypothetical protein